MKKRLKQTAHYKEIEDKIKAIVIKVFDLDVKKEELDAKTPLFEGGVGLDSVATLEIIVAMEEEFDVRVSDDEFDMEIMYSIETLTGFIAIQIL